MFANLICAIFLIGCPLDAPVEVSSPSVEKQPAMVVAPDLSGIPKASRPYAALIKSISKNPSREAALTEQESGWNTFAESPYASGLRQFTKSTGEWLSLGLCKDLGPYDKFNDNWQLRCGVRYAESLETSSYGSYCNNRKIGEQRYNGGYYVLWELETANSSNLSKAEAVCGTRLHNGRKRSMANCRENYGYTRHISMRQPKYVSLGGRQC